MMPAFDAKAPHVINSVRTKLLAHGLHPTADNDIAYQLSELRKEITALRNQLTPQQSSILTGSEVVRVFSELKGGAV